MKKNKFYYYNLFLIVPILSTTISTYHIISLFNLGNNFIVSLLLAITFEIGSISAFLLPSIYKKVNKNLLYIVFIILFFMQVVGNVFYSYDYIFEKLKEDKTWLDSFISFMNNIIFIGSNNNNKHMFYLSILIGVFIPVISLFFLKSWIEYLQTEKSDNNDIVVDDNNINDININNNINKEEKVNNLINIDNNDKYNNEKILDLNKEENNIKIIYNTIDKEVNLNRNIINDEEDNNAIINNMI